jgi:probable HAF family extracellular repeat protein
MVGLGDLPAGYPTSSATGVSANGSVIVGRGSTTSGSSLTAEAFRWTASSGIVGLGYLPGAGGEFFESSAFGVSGDGAVVVGVGSSASGYEAFRWTEDSGMLGLGQLPGSQYGSATAVNADGSVIVGFSYVSGSAEAFRWSAASRMERLWDVLLVNGLDPAADGWTSLWDARGVSADGNTIVGTGIRNGNAEAFIAVIPQSSLLGDFNNDGNVDAADYVVWRKSLGTQADYDSWRTHFGESIGSGSDGYPLGDSADPLSAAVPEPAALGLLFIGSALWPLRPRPAKNL